MAGQPRVPAGTPTKGRIHPGEYANTKAKPPGRRDRGARGRAGAPAPPKAPIHARKLVHPKTPGSTHHDPAGGKMPDEMVGGFECSHCRWPGWREHRVVTKEGATHATLAFKGCTNCGTMHVSSVGVAEHAKRENAAIKRRVGKTITEDLAEVVRKSIDSSDTELGRQDLERGTTDLVGHRQGCPKGGNAPCGKEKGGRCTVCDLKVQDHQALGKTQATLLELRKLAGLY